jgi:hypothetical protein
MKISFAGEAYESFQTMVEGMRGFGVTITTVEGKTVEGYLYGPDRGNEWGDAVRVRVARHPSNDVWDEDPDSPNLNTISVRAEEIEVH